MNKDQDKDPNQTVPTPFKKIPRLLLLMILILIAGGVLYFASKSLVRQKSAIPSISPLPIVEVSPSSQISDKNWKSYTASELGFSFSYRSDIEVTKNENTIKLYHWSPEQDEEVYSGFIVIAKNANYFTLEDYVFQELCGLKSSTNIQNPNQQEIQAKIYQKSCAKSFIDSKTEVKIAGLNGIRGNVNSGENPSLVSLIKKDDSIYVFRLYGSGTGAYPSKTAISTYNQILSTFRFLEDNDKKSYINPEYKYSFQYPVDWDTFKKGDTLEVAPAETIDKIKNKSEPGPAGVVSFMGMSINDYSKSEFTNIPPEESNEYRTVTKEQITVGGKTATKYTSVFKKTLQGFEGRIDAGSVFIRIEIPVSDSVTVISFENKQYEEIYSQILSTLKFLE